MNAHIIILMLLIFILSIFIPSGNYNIIISLLISLGITLLMGLPACKAIRIEKHDITIDLLFEDNIELIENLKKFLSDMKNRNASIINISIMSKDKGIIKVADSWIRSRKGILNQEVEIRITDGRLNTALDLSKRNIKYSKLSILIDYLCYIKDKGNVGEIELSYL